MNKGLQLQLTLYLCCLLVLPTQSQVTADFTASSTLGCGSLQVSFTDLSTSTAGNIVSWSWDLGGVSSSTRNPGRIFGTPGFYEICLTATDSEGNSSTTCKDDYIHILHLPQPDFTVDNQLGCAPLEVTFTDASIGRDGAIVEWIWGLGGSTGVVVGDSTLGDVNSTYNVPDDYTISLTLIDENNCTNTVTRADYIQVSPDPIVDVSVSNTFGCQPPLVVSFSNDGLTQDMEFQWEFGNGASFTGTTPPPIVYTEQGSFSVRIIGTHLVSGCADTLVLNEAIVLGNPIDFTPSVMSGCEDLPVVFRDNSPDAADSVRWNFGNGQESVAANPTFVYDTPGCYFVTLTRWVGTCETSQTLTECIEVFREPVPSYFNDNSLGCEVPHTVNFFGAGSGVTEWAWDFGDGTTSDLQNPQHTYTNMGIFPVSLTVTNADGCTNTVATDTISIIALSGGVVPTRYFDCSPVEVTLTDQSTTVAPITNWEWRVTNNAFSPPISFTSFDTVPTFTLTDTGRYEVTLILTNAIGCVDTTVVDGLIGVGIPPVINFDADPRVSCIFSPIQFSDLSSNYADEWLWEFGDGGESDSQYPIYEYKDTGYFDVKLTAFMLGCAAELEIDSFIFIDPPKAQFTLNRDCATPYTVSANDLSIGADRIHWDFGVTTLTDDTSNVAEPTYVYAETGVYTITQVVENFTTGCTDTARIRWTVTDPKAIFDLDRLEGCVPLAIQINDASEFADVYEWSTTTPGVFSNAAISDPTITFNTPGKYAGIQLIITDIVNCQDTMLFTDTITVNGSNADFTVDPTGGCMPLSVNFTDQSSSVFGSVVDWDWQFGTNLGTSDQVNPTFEFNEAGLQPVTLTVTDDKGCSDTHVYNHVDVTFPVANFVADTFGCTKHFIAFTDQSGGRGLSYFWEFGDGETSTTQSPTHYYANEGTYDICLTVSNVYGCDSTLCRPAYVTIADPVAAFSADKTFASCPPLLVNFENNSLNSSTYVWDFGDGSGTSILDAPPHIYTIPGVYDVSIIASSTDNCHDTLLIEDYIVLDGPLGSFHFDNDTSCIPAPITFYGESVEPYMFIWDFGNGVLDTTVNVMADTLTYTYEEVGDFVPKLILVNSQGCARALESPDTIHTALLDVDFIATDSILCGDASATFLNVTNSSRPIGFVEWTFEGLNPATSNSFEPVVTYDTAGTFDVQLVAGNGFCFDTIVKPDFIRIGAVPQASFALNPSSACVPAVIDFFDASSIGDGTIVDWEWNFGDSTNSTDQNPSHTYQEPGEYEVVLLVRTLIGCTSEFRQTVTIHPRPIVDFGPTPNICIGELVQLSANFITTDITDFYWMPDTTLSCTDCQDPWVNPIDTTTYYFVSMNSLGCIDTAEVLVEVRPFHVPVISISQDTTICVNDIAMLSIQSDGVGDVYAWERSRQGLTCYDCPEPVASPDLSTNYIVTVTNVHDCSSWDSVTVSVVDENQPFAGDDRIICEGDTIQLSLSTGNNPLWLEASGLSCGMCMDPLAFPDSTTTYIVRVTTDIGCDIYDTLTVTVMHPDDIDAGDSTRICLGEQTQLNGQILMGDVAWTPAATLNNASILDPMARPDASGHYTMTVTNGECVMSDSVHIEVQERVELTGLDTTICEGEIVDVEIGGLADSYLWLPIRGVSDISSPNPSISPFKTTTYSVIGQMGTCVPDTAEVYVTVIPKPEVELHPKRNTFNGEIIKLNIDDDGSRGYEYEWTPPVGLSCRSCPSPAAEVDTTTSYTLIVTDPQTGCTDTSETIIEVLITCPEELINMPNIFTPNGDGNNDILKVLHSPSIETIKSFTIFDRWGEMVFRTSDINEGWNGIYEGVPMHKGVYVYLIEAECPLNGSLIFKSGDVTLIRN